MTKFVLLFRMDITTPGAQPDKEKMRTYMQQWMDWIAGISGSGRLADGGNHLASTGRVLRKNAVVPGPYLSDTVSVAGYIIVLAENIEEATAMASQCPILQGDANSVEIREVASPG